MRKHTVCILCYASFRSSCRQWQTTWSTENYDFGKRRQKKKQSSVSGGRNLWSLLQLWTLNYQQKVASRKIRVATFGKNRTTGSTFSERKNSQSLNSDQFLYACSNALKQKIGCWVVDSTYGHVICVKYQFPKSVKTCYPAFSLISPLVFER